MLKKIIKSTLQNIFYLRDFKKFKKLSRTNPRFTAPWKNRRPCLHDNTPKTYFDRHYVYHTGWAARILAQTKPKKHIDISSSLYFASIASAFVPFEFYDYRPAKLELSNLSSKHADLCKLSFANQSIKSISCMHVVEHIGLGRYGDPLDPNGDLKAMSELQRVLAPQGNLIFVVPVGKPVIMFNAHRVYSYDQVVKNFPELKLTQLALIHNNEKDGEIIYNPPKEKIKSETYSCGCFWFTREK